MLGQSWGNQNNMMMVPSQQSLNNQNMMGDQNSNSNIMMGNMQNNSQSQLSTSNNQATGSQAQLGQSNNNRNNNMMMSRENSNLDQDKQNNYPDRVSRDSEGNVLPQSGSEAGRSRYSNMDSQMQNL